MRLLLAIAATGCWTGTPPPAPRSNRCELRERLVEPAAPVRLGIAHRRFAEVTGPAVRIEIVVTAGEARALIETEAFEIEGELELDEFALRPKQLLHDGWLEVRHAIPRAAYERHLRLEVDLPDGLQPRWTSIDVPCDELTVTAPPAVSESEPWVELPAGTSTMLFRSPGRDPLRAWTAPKRPTTGDADFLPLVARVIERRGRDLRVRISDRNAVIAWIAASAISEIEDGNVYGGLMADDLSGIKDSVTCDRRTPIYVRADGKRVRVGLLKPDQPLPARRTKAGEIELGLGGNDATPFLASGTAGCTLR